MRLYKFSSNSRYHKWKNLVKGLVPAAANQIWVADITHIELADGNVCYLHLITDAYSHKIIGWVLADTLRAACLILTSWSCMKLACSRTGRKRTPKARDGSC